MTLLAFAFGIVAGWLLCTLHRVIIEDWPDVVLEWIAPECFFREYRP